jgi:hypothetical protein
MTPVEKAQELYAKYESILIDTDAYFVKCGAFDCALEACELALEFAGGDMEEQFDKILFLVEVKHELEYMRTKHLEK